MTDSVLTPQPVQAESNRTVWKYTYPVADAQEIEIPMLAEFHPIGRMLPHHWFELWAEVNPNAMPQKRTLYVCGTGHPVPDFSEYVTTLFDGPLVWHIYLSLYNPDVQPHAMTPHE